MADSQARGPTPGEPGDSPPHTVVPGPDGRRPRSRRRKALLITVCVLVAVVLLGGAGITFVYFKLNGNISSIDVDARIGPRNRPADLPNGSMDVLVLGSDSRAGKNSEYGRGGGARSDTAMIVHIYEDRKRASVVSIPRDTLVDRPACPKNGGGTAPPAKRSMFNEAYSVGGPACSVKTVEAMTGIRMDHFIEIDFTGFKNIIDELGGVEITTKKAIDDPDSHLKLEPGTHTLDGEQSLGLVRTRKGIGDGSDLGRIHLQQAFVRALVKQVEEINLLTSWPQLYRIADTATKSVTTDDDMASVGELTSLARSLSEIDSEDLRMVTLPVTFDPADPNRVVPMERNADRVWQALKEDKPIPESALEGSLSDGRDPDGVIPGSSDGHNTGRE